jgi:hypothetical protein
MRFTQVLLHVTLASFILTTTACSKLDEIYEKNTQKNIERTLETEKNYAGSYYLRKVEDNRVAFTWSRTFSDYRTEFGTEKKIVQSQLLEIAKKITRDNNKENFAVSGLLFQTIEDYNSNYYSIDVTGYMEIIMTDNEIEGVKMYPSNES